MKTTALLFVMLLVGAVSAIALTQPAAKPAAPTPAGMMDLTKDPARPSIDQLAFLEGDWKGEKDGAVVEEIWSAPSGNNIVGCFRWLKKTGKPSMFEILALTEEDDGIYLRLHHYSSKLVGKEPSDKPLTLRLSKIEVNTAEFTPVAAGDLSKIVYTVSEKNLKITVEFAGGASALKFDLTKK